MSKQGKLKIIPLGGLGEVGKNMTAYEFNGQIIVVDTGIMSPRTTCSASITSFPITSICANAKQVIGIVITHGHEDHIGAVPHLVNDIPAPLYATSLNSGLDRGQARPRT